MLSDAGALALALAAQRMAERPRTRARTFGFRRTETLAALANATALTASAALICAEAIRRLLEGGSQVSEGRAVLGVAAAGLGVNLVSAWVLSRGGETRSVNVRAALAHVLSDAAGSLAAIVAGLAIVLFEAHWCDPASSLFIAGLVALASFRLLRQVTHVLMEGAPVGLDVSALETTIRTTAGVADLHDLHAWTIEEGFDAVTVHVVIESGAHGVEVAREVSRRIRRVHGVEHITVQPEAPSDPPLVPVSSLTRKTEERGQISKGTR